MRFTHITKLDRRSDIYDRQPQRAANDRTAPASVIWVACRMYRWMHYVNVGTPDVTGDWQDVINVNEQIYE
eukprot:scaffold47888_cov22-Prasinocladus_malaysianus.AAC.2